MNPAETIAVSICVVLAALLFVGQIFSDDD